jgi:hypothetical protein
VVRDPGNSSPAVVSRAMKGVAMSDPKEQKDEKVECDDLELAPEMVKDLEVGDEHTGAIRGGCSGSGTLSLNR